MLKWVRGGSNGTARLMQDVTVLVRMSRLRQVRLCPDQDHRVQVGVLLMADMLKEMHECPNEAAMLKQVQRCPNGAAMLVRRVGVLFRMTRVKPVRLCLHQGRSVRVFSHSLSFLPLPHARVEGWVRGGAGTAQHSTQ
jgi:hypothetical protein